MTVNLESLAYYADCAKGNPGTQFVLATHPLYCCPVGICWYAFPLIATLEVLDLYVNQHFRRQGIGRSIIEWLIENYPERTVCTETLNIFSHGLFVRLGFQRTKQGWMHRQPEPCPII